MACGDDDDLDPAPNEVSIRVVHASPDAPAVDVYAQGVATPLFTDVAYGEATGTVTVDAGTYTLELRAAGSPATAAPAYRSGPLVLGGGARVTAVAAGKLGSTDDADELRLLPLVEDWGADVANRARVRVVHASADAPTVGVDVGDDGSAELTLARFADSGAAGVELPAGDALQIGVRAGGARVTAFTTPELAAGSELLIVATGLLASAPRADDGFALLAVGPDGVVGLIKQNPVVYALHGSPDAPAVDLFAGSAEVADDLAFAELSGAIQVPPGSYTLDVFAHAAGATRPAGAPVAALETPELAAGGRYLAIASGFLDPGAGEEPFHLLAYDEAFVVQTAAARVRVVHASPDAPTVDVGAVSGATFTPLFRDLEFSDATDAAGADLAPGAVTIGVAAAGSTSPVARFGLTAAAARASFAIALGALTPATGRQGFRLVLVETTGATWSATAVSPAG